MTSIRELRERRRREPVDFSHPRDLRYCYGQQLLYWVADLDAFLLLCGLRLKAVKITYEQLLTLPGDIRRERRVLGVSLIVKPKENRNA